MWDRDLPCLGPKVSRLAAIVGVVTVGLLSHQPAFYVKWGRFTQVATQSITLIGWLVTWEAICVWSSQQPISMTRKLAYAALAALLNSSLFSLHFRVGAFYLPLLLFCIIWEHSQARRTRRVLEVWVATVVIGLLTILFVTPVLIPGLEAYISQQLAQVANPANAKLSDELYFALSWRSVRNSLTRMASGVGSVNCDHRSFKAQPCGARNEYLGGDVGTNGECLSVENFAASVDQHGCNTHYAVPPDWVACRFGCT